MNIYFLYRALVYLPSLTPPPTPCDLWFFGVLYIQASVLVVYVVVFSILFACGQVEWWNANQGCS